MAAEVVSPADYAEHQGSGFEDKELQCKDCGNPFTWTASEQEFFAERDFSEPPRCRSCRQSKKTRMNDSSSGYGRGYNSGYGGGYQRGPGLCYDFQDGRCTRGDSCRFSHDASGGGGDGGYERRGYGGGGGYGGYSGGGGGGVRQVCYSFQNGNCKYGDSCRFSHEGGGGGGGYSERRSGYGFGQGRDSGRSPGICYKFQEGHCQYGDSCRFSHST